MKTIPLIFAFLISSFMEVSAQNEDVRAAMNDFRYSDALKLLENLPESRDNLLLKAESYQQLYDYTSAIAYYEKAIAADPDFLPSYIAMAECQYQAGDADASLKYWRLANDLSPDNLFLKTKKTMAHYRASDWKGTIESANHIFRTDSIPMLLRMMGDAYLYSANGDSAIWYYNKAIEKNPADHVAVLKLGNVYHSAKFYDSTIELTNKYLSRINNKHKAIGQLNGMANYSAGNNQKALNRLMENIILGDSSYTTNYYLGMTFYAMRSYSNAATWLGKAYNFNSDINLLYYYGTALAHTSERQKGIKILLEGVSIIEEMNEMMYDFDFSLANAHLRSSDYNKAVQYFKSAYNRQPDKYHLFYNIAYAYDSMKDYKNAISYYEQFVKSKPDHIDLDKEIDFSDLTQLRSAEDFYKIAATRIDELKKEQFMKGKK